MLLPKVFVDNLFNDDFGPLFPEHHPMLRNNDDWMKTDVIEKDASYELDMNLPGFNKDNVKVTLDKGYLTISANTSNNNESKDNEGHVIRRERFQGSCSRSFYVGENVTKEDVKAKFENGVLHLSIPKKQATKQISEQLIDIE